MVIRSIKDHSTTSILSLHAADARLFDEIAKYELLTEDLKTEFLRLLVEDAQKLARACDQNPELLEEAFESIDKMSDIIRSLDEHEAEDIRKSEEIQRLVPGALDKMNQIKEHLESLSDTQEEQEEKQEQQDRFSRYMK